MAPDILYLRYESNYSLFSYGQISTPLSLKKCSFACILNIKVLFLLWMLPFLYNMIIAKSVGAVEYTDWISAEGKDAHPTPNECSEYDTKQSDGEVPLMLEFWEMWSTPSLPSLPGPLWPEVVAPDRVPSMGPIELNCILMLNWITWNRAVLMFKLHTYAKLNCLKSVKKVILTVFWDMKGPITVDFLEKGATVNSTPSYQLLRQYFTLLLNDPCACVYIFVKKRLLREKENWLSDKTNSLKVLNMYIELV